MLNLILNTNENELENKFEKEFDERKGIEFVKNLNEELNEFLLFYFEKIRKINGIEENLIQFVKLICKIFDRIENLSKKFKNFKNFIDLIYMNFYKAITILESEFDSENLTNFFQIIFFKFWEILLKLENFNYFYSNSEKFQKSKKFVADKLSLIFLKIFDSLLDEENQMKVFTNFIENFLPNLIITLNFNMENNSQSASENFIDAVEILSKNFDKIKFVIDLYFKNFNFLSKDKNLFKTIYRNFFQKNLLDSSLTERSGLELESSEKLENLLSSNNYELILKMTRLLVYNKNLLQTFLKILLSSLKIQFEKIYQTSLKEKNYSKNLNFFIELNKYEQNLFKKEILFFVDSTKLIFEFRILLNQILNNAKKEKEIFFSESFDLILRQKNFGLVEIILENFNFGIIKDFSRFEDDYIRKMIERSIDEVFDKTKESEIINKIVISNKDAFSYSFKLQTALNNIKIIRKSFVNLVGVPSHCYSGINRNKNFLGCEPVVKDKYLLNIFEDTKVSQNFPKNSKLILQQGWIEFNFVKNRNTLFRSNLLSFMILKLIYAKKNPKFKIEEIIEYFEINQTLCNFLLDNLIENKLIEKSDNEISSCKLFSTSNFEKKFTENFIRESNESNIKKVFLVLDLNEEFIKYKNSNSNFNFYNEFSEKEFNQIVDCYIMKYLKKAKESSSSGIFESIKNLSVFIIRNKGIRLDEDKILERLNHLSVNSYIRKINSQKFSYN